MRGYFLSGRLESNQQSHAPHACAMPLRYAPTGRKFSGSPPSSRLGSRLPCGNDNTLPIKKKRGKVRTHLAPRSRFDLSGVGSRRNIRRRSFSPKPRLKKNALFKRRVFQTHHDRNSGLIGHFRGIARRAIDRLVKENDLAKPGNVFALVQLPAAKISARRRRSKARWDRRGPERNDQDPLVALASLDRFVSSQKQTEHALHQNRKMIVIDRFDPAKQAAGFPAPHIEARCYSFHRILKPIDNACRRVIVLMASYEEPRCKQSAWH